PPGARVPGEWCAGLRSHSGTKPGQVSSQGCTFLARRRPRPEGRKRAAGAAAGRLLLRPVSVARDHDMAVSAGPSRTRLTTFLVYALVLVFALGLAAATPTAAHAQEGAPEPAKKADDQQQKSEPNLFVHILESAGWFFGPLLFLVSIGLVTLIVLLAMDLRMSVAIPPAFVDH